MSLSMNLTGRRIVVTGASSGIGEAVCRSLVKFGASVVMLARRQERLDAVSTDLGNRAVGISCDVTNLAALEMAIGQAAERFGNIDAVIAVAGRGMVGSIHTGSPEAWRELMDLNLIGPLATVRYAVGHFPKEGRRDIVFVGSTGGITPMPGVGIYGATKRGLRAAFDTMRLEVADMGVNTSLVMPGMFLTEGLTEGVAFSGDFPPSDMPMFASGGGPASPKPLADAVAFMLALPEGVCINEMVIRPTGQLNP